MNLKEGFIDLRAEDTKTSEPRRIYFNGVLKEMLTGLSRVRHIRHTFNTNMRKAGVERSVIMKITGHKTMSIFERYNTVDRGDAHEAIK